MRRHLEGDMGCKNDTRINVKQFNYIVKINNVLSRDSLMNKAVRRGVNYEPHTWFSEISECVCEKWRRDVKLADPPSVKVTRSPRSGSSLLCFLCSPLALLSEEGA